MKRRNTVFSLMGLATSSAAIVAISTAGAFANVPVTDPGSKAELATQTTTLANQEKSLTEIEEHTEQTADAVGEQGPQGPGAFKPSSDPFYETLEDFAFDPCAINLCQVGTNYTGEDDFERAREWVQKNYFTSEVLNNEETRDLMEVRRRAAIYASTGGLAMATIVHNDLAGAGADADALESEVENSEDLRSDIAVNSKVLLAQYKLEVQKLAVLTAMLEVEAINALSTTDATFELGGTKFPDAFIDDDFAGGADFSRRLEVTSPTKGVATPAP